ncbi:Trp biosynthesis-associated membrane protein [Serinicoccus chungangensis]|uniref:Trp biosynthesis-associated membrane protein n=1 Tax=Serinicoccus chungangensis TaxID=767452 RepID=UPI0013052DC7|nr:Trp biosynthesis-associated membrane protein [Serinicoccus chungangensis]
MLVLLAASTGLVSTGQPWVVRQGVDAAGVATQESWTGRELAAPAVALLLVVAAAALTGLAWRGRGAVAARVLALAAAVAALVLVVAARPQDPTPWWWVGLGGAAVAVLGALVAALPAGSRGTEPGDPAQAGRRTRSGVRQGGDVHELARRSDEASWSALSRGEDPTLAPGRTEEGAAGTMSDEGRTGPPSR